MSESKIIVRAANTANEIEKLRSFWARFNRHPESDIDFVLMLASVRLEIVRPHILVAYEDGQPVALLVGRLENTMVRPRIGYLKLFNISVNQFVFVGGRLLGEASDRVASAMIREIRKTLCEGHADRVLISHFPIADILNKFVKCKCPMWCRGFAHLTVQHWKTELPDTFEAFLAKRPKKHRYWLRRIRKVFETQFEGKVKYAIFQAPQDVEPFCKAAETVAQSTYQRGLGAGFIDNEENRKRLALMAQNGWLRSYVVFVENKPLAFWSGERIGDTFYLTWTGFDSSYCKYEIGTILFLEMVDDLLSCGIKEMDYGLGWAQYKERFGDSCLLDQDVVIYAPTIKAFGLNLILALEDFVNRVGKKLLSMLKVRDKFKKLWRSGLADKTTSKTTNNANTQAGEIGSS
jgi:hypothetical protein